MKASTGNHVTEKNHAMLESRLGTRLRQLGFEAMDQYWKYYDQHESAELSVLQGLLTTHHTFFFREYAHFEALEAWIEKSVDRFKDKSAGPVRVLSAGCSRGHEVYSLAIFLEAKLAQRHGVAYEIVGGDVDMESIAYAQNGVYPIREINTIPTEYLAHFKRGKNHLAEFAAVHPSLKRHVTFEVLNLSDSASLAALKPCDVIFCRNVFIYFTEQDVARIAQSLSARLRPSGIFVSGLSEPLRFAGWQLANVGPSVYQKAGPAVAQPRPSAVVPHLSLVPAPEPLAVATKKYSVLCVDDSPVIQTLLKKIFSFDPECVSVDTALNGAEARKKLDAKRYDLITLDIHMPEVTGIEFLERLYRRGDDPPVVMVSSVNRSDVDLATKALSLGAFDYVEKPAMNSLAKSRDELLLKGRMARRAAQVNAQSKTAEPVTVFDQSIAQKIVVPDASQCLRVVFAAETNLKALEHVVKGQGAEQRSPALLIALPLGVATSAIEARVLDWTHRKVSQLRQATEVLKPNSIYLVYGDEMLNASVQGSFAKAVSVQILDTRAFDFAPFKKFARRQILVDEARANSHDSILRGLQSEIDDVVPSTSFASMSVEFFANLRRRAA